MDNQEKKHQRRVRYSGTHPKTYKEKYKELQPDKYMDTISKVIQKGSTPAGMHRSICVDEILEILDVKPGQIGLDATLGFGGHTSEILKCLDFKGHLYATDVDAIELPKTRERLASKGYDDKILTIQHLNFSQIDQIVVQSGPLDFILADLGVSSMQIDNPDRGFSFKIEGPLDLRLNPEKGISAAQRLKNVTQEELQYMLLENADEPNAELISKAIMKAVRSKRPITTTTHLQEIIKETLQFLPEKTRSEDIKKACQRCFQALRIDVNSEFEVLHDLLEKIPDALKSGGKVAILTFHSGEDRMVKKSFKHFLKEGIYKEIANEAIRPSAKECSTNGRARSAKLRWAIRA